MTALQTTLRNDVLRISLKGGEKAAPQTQEEFRDLLASAPAIKTVIVELPNVRRLDPEAMRMLLGFQRSVEATGRKLRVNGLSELVSEVLARLGQPLFAGPRMNRGLQHSGFVAAT